MRACNLGSVEVTQQSSGVPHQMASWVIRLASKTTESGRYQVTIEQFYFWRESGERGSLFMDMAMGVRGIGVGPSNFERCTEGV